MTAPFLLMDRHADAPRAPDPGGRVVFSRLTRGETPISGGGVCVKYVLEGEERYEAGGRIHVVKAGQLLIVDQATPMRAILPRREPTLGTCIYLPADLAGGIGAFAGEAYGGVTLLQAAGTRLGAAMARTARALAAGARPRAPDRLVRRTAVELGALVSDTEAQLKRLGAAKPSTRYELLRRLDRARAYLHERQDRVVPLAELSVLCGVSPFHLARHFREAYGLPPAAYHAALRLDAAARLLARGRTSRDEVAARFGYGDTVAFSRALGRRFRKIDH